MARRIYIKTRRSKKRQSSNKRRMGGAPTATVYVVLENSEQFPSHLYPILYSTYASAREAVTTKYEEELTIEREDVAEMNDPSYEMVSSVDVDENETGTTYLYIERGIHITIQRYSVP